MPSDLSATDTIVTFALVLRGKLESIPEVKRFLQERGFVIAFQKLSAEKLYIHTEPPEGL